jgi:hypothetical protein
LTAATSVASFFAHRLAAAADKRDVEAELLMEE